jgi:hypothetical protein
MPDQNTLAVPGGSVAIDLPSPLEPGRGEFHVTRLSLSGDTVRRTTVRYEPIAFSDSMLNALAESRANTPLRTSFLSRGRSPRAETPAASPGVTRQIRAAMAFPEYQPPLRQVWIANDGALWLRRHDAADDAPTEWIVLDTMDRVRGVVSIPAQTHIRWAAGEMMWALELDDDGVPWAVEYRVR